MCFSLMFSLNRLDKLRKSSTELRNFNDENAQELAKLSRELERYTKMDRQMKRDLEDIFRRLRGIKRTLEQRYPQYIGDATRAVEENARAKGRSLDEDEDEEEIEEPKAKERKEEEEAKPEPQQEEQK